MAQAIDNPPAIAGEVMAVELGTLQATTPSALVSGATDMAGNLSRIIQQQRLSVGIQGKQYVKVEGWTTLGTMMGVVAREVETTEQDGIYTAVVELVRISDGVVISRASAECGAPDEKDRKGKQVWSNRPRYARRSMAQTRATSKACRLAFSWVMTLAGYEATPAEEMTHETEARNVTHVHQAPETPASDPLQGEAVEAQPETIISKTKHRQLEATIKDLGLDRERVKAWLKRSTANRAGGPIEHLNQLPQRMFDPLLHRLDQWACAAQQEDQQSA